MAEQGDSFEPAAAAWRLRLGGHELTAEARPREGGTTVALTVDGRVLATEPVSVFGPDLALAELDAGLDLESLDLAGGRLQARSWRRGTLRSCRLVVPPAGNGAPGKGRPERIDFEPPDGTRARRAYDFAQTHPRWYAARHVGVATAQVLLALVGISLVVSWISWDWLPHIPSISFPDLPLPDVPSIPLPDLPDVAVPGWVQAVLDSKRYWLPILVAVFVASREVQRRRRRQEQQGEPAESPGDGPGEPR